MDLKTRIAIFAYLKNLKAPAQTHFLKHYLQLIVMWGVLRYIFAPELVTHILLTILPWYLVGIISYLQTVWIIIEPTWRGRLYNIMITGTVIYLSFMSSYPRSYDTMLPWMILLVLCSLFYPLYSTERFRSGYQD